MSTRVPLTPFIVHAVQEDQTWTDWAESLDAIMTDLLSSHHGHAGLRASGPWTETYEVYEALGDSEALGYEAGELLASPSRLVCGSVGGWDS